MRSTVRALLEAGFQRNPLGQAIEPILGPGLGDQESCRIQCGRQGAGPQSGGSCSQSCRPEFVECPKDLERAGKVLERGAGLAVFLAPSRIGEGFNALLRQGLVEQMPTASER